MKKTLLAALMLTAFGASAANVTLYGSANPGFFVHHQTVSNSDISSRTSLTMESGQYAGSRWGLKGNEDLGNGVKVEFQLESGFSADDGTLGQNSRMFGRESRVAITAPCGGRINFGRMGVFTYNTGTFGDYFSYGDALGGGWDQAVSVVESLYAYEVTRADNAVVINTPTMAGLTLYGLYSLNTNGAEADHSRGNSRLASVMATYERGPAKIAVVAEKLARKGSDIKAGLDDMWQVQVGGSWDFGPAALYANYQYVRHSAGVHGMDSAMDLLSLGNVYGLCSGMKGNTGSISASAKVFAGTLAAGVGYGKFDAEDTSVMDATVKTTMAYVGYEYPLSKRTTVYGGVGYAQHKVSTETAVASTSNKIRSTDVLLGVNHKF